MEIEKEVLDKDKTLNLEIPTVHAEESEFLHEEEAGYPDVSHYTKEQLLNEVQALKPEGNLSKLAGFLRDLKNHFDELTDAEKQEALANFLNEGGVEEDFQLKKDEVTLKFEKIFSKIRQDVSEKLSGLEQEKEKNLKTKIQILERLRDLTSGEENSTSLNALKDIQNEWKNTGPVPPSRSKELWANYNALVEMFYNNRSIYFELKELDRKKNLEAKVDVIARAEKLAGIESVSEAIKELKKLHEEYKNLGPVPKEDQETLWTRFKAASDKVYEKRNSLAESARVVHEENLKKKQALIAKVKECVAFNTEEINAWKDKTKEVLEIQEQWKGIGAVPKEVNKDISKEFWSGYKGFFKNKEVFFRNLENKKKENLDKKIALCERVEVLKDSLDLENATEEIKRLQADWNKIGPVPVKEKEEIFKRFKAACDHFFNKKREQFAEQEKEYEGNLQKKNEIIAQIEQLAVEGNKNPDDIRELQVKFNAIGFVPKKDIKDVKDKYRQAVENFLKTIDGYKGKDKDRVRLELEVSALKSDPAARKKLGKKESDVLKRIHELKSDIKTFTTNIEFLANSPKAAKLKEQVERNIEECKKELATLEDQLSIIRETR